MSRRTALALLLTCAGALFIGLHAHAAGGSVVPHVMTAAEAATTILDDGRVALTTQVSGDLRGPLTVAFHVGPDGQLAGEWALAVSYVQDVDASGNPVAFEPHEDGDADAPEHHDHHEVLIQRGVLKGEIAGGTMTLGDNGAIAAIDGVWLQITGGTQEFAAVTSGSGFLSLTSLQDGGAATGSLDLTF
jgi:hypothetical protein